VRSRLLPLCKKHGLEPELLQLLLLLDVGRGAEGTRKAQVRAPCQLDFQQALRLACCRSPTSLSQFQCSASLVPAVLDVKLMKAQLRAGDMQQTRN
jgi:hypothetical protein